MKWILLDTPHDLAEKAYHWLEQRLSHPQSPDAIYLPAGQTPIPLYQKIEAQKPQWLEGKLLLPVDEILSPTTGQYPPFQDFFRKNLPSYQKQFHWIDRAGPMAEVGILGFGWNGHVAFHEPELPSTFLGGEVTLQAGTCKELGVPNGTKGITYGVGSFLKTDSLLLIIWGKKKKAAFQRFLKGDLTVPANFLKNHPDLTILVDNALFQQSDGS